MVSDELLKMMRCLETGSPLRRADAKLCQQINEAIDAGKIRNRWGRSVDRQMDEGLVNAERTLLYPVYNEVPRLLREEAIEVGQLEQE